MTTEPLRISGGWEKRLDSSLSRSAGLNNGEIYITRTRYHKYPAIWGLYTDMVASYWVPEEVDLNTDLREWDTILSESAKTFLKNIFAFFTFGDGIVIENAIRNFMNEFKDSDIRFTYVTQMFFETLHANTYAIILDTLVRDRDEMNRLEQMFNQDNSFAALKAWVESYMESKDHSLACRVLAFACFEGIIFSGAFCAIFWLKKQGRMPGLTFSNELISRDEGTHCDFACLLFDICNKEFDDTPSYLEACAIIMDSVDVASNFITEIAPCDLLGINSVLMIQYLKFVANRLFSCLEAYQGLDPPYKGAQNPFDWMELISLQGKTNFFERRVSEYSNAAITTKLHSSSDDNGYGGEEYDDNVFTTDADF